MDYLSISMADSIRHVSLVRLPDSCDINFVVELRDALSPHDVKAVYIDLTGCKQDSVEFDPIKCKAFHDNLRRLLSRLIFEDVIYVGVLKNELRDLAVEIILSLDYILYSGDTKLSFSNKYAPIASGYTYAVFRGGIALVNRLYRGVKIDELVEDGFLIGDKYEGGWLKTEIDFHSILKRKKLFRELFLRDFQHINHLEFNFPYRL